MQDQLHLQDLSNLLDAKLAPLTMSHLSDQCGQYVRPRIKRNVHVHLYPDGHTKRCEEEDEAYASARCACAA